MERQIVHLNIASFMASVEEICDRSLRDTPFVIAPQAKSRSVVIDTSPRAFMEGARKGMPLDYVRRMIKGIHVIPPREELYRKAEKCVYLLSCGYSPAVEQMPGGHLFIDLTGTRLLFGKTVDSAAKIKQEITDRLGLRPIAGIAVNKLVSKVATRVVRPYGFVSISPGDEQNFLKHQAICILPGVGLKLHERMTILGIREIGELAELSDDESMAFLGGRGIRLRNSARGIDNSAVENEPASMLKIKAGRIFDTDTNDAGHIRAQLFSLSEDMGSKLRGNNLSAKKLELALGYTDGKKTALGSRTGSPFFCDADIFDAAQALMGKSPDRRVRLRKIELALSGLQAEHEQLDLFIPPDKIKKESLQQAIDSIRKRFGMDSIHRGLSMKAC